MKLLRHGLIGAEKPGLMDGQGVIRDLSGQVADIGGAVLSDDGLAAIGSLDVSELPAVPEGTRLGAPIAGIGKMICIGLNYADHAAESGATVPPEPLIFMKATSAIQGPNDPIVIPRGAEQTDWEVELGIVIGKPAKYVSEEDAMDYVAGYVLANDVSERSYQKDRSGQWTKGKSCDSFGPLGPYLVTRDAVADPQKLAMKLSVNGEVMQNGSTETMVFGVKKLVSYLSQFMTLHPGDVISTGTPPGVAMGMETPRFLRPGDVVELEIEGLGQQRAEVVADA
ncbi:MULTISPECIES: fumarylacetoacetate hydrolase family protein [Thioclava]|uniref:2-hydroxyhepta-2,4-diene-1,7-dioate isomerase n=1 Tax=Thioclava nitratireducens TaxID=1915078 RepID=A0ABM6IHV3_9RHOB|nr:MULTISPECIES: fumarylacetoacetate hydrolase family protein [Thioclava]AQS48410.1 2-hydroxyhepta-2,4-diene-1,7-dioate isomerase [Thioclava nitratireducens]OWY04847.1 2-hydroxyhepta-2,4-diene-1,7-dioate isomerase [Thioclava sp. F1Mire-8]OWY06462.1 2-hydroxyhepta-2,4-diene-1,7-dioate isomerase [Thioclava sp. IC9]OWY15225.1 2-hydroxyhepta-2,4-diene-1,7-dioate isomerase [Thioclava sp. F34-6]OWY18622.1 2-hydroxyhepta-2,4-diene-1,7-dioate isomerase [Thioclava sp. JM3]